MVRNRRAKRSRSAAGSGVGSNGGGVRGVAQHDGVRRRAVQLRGSAAGDEGTRVMNELAGHTLVQAADLVASGQTTSLELLHACWANLDAVNPQVSAVIWQEREQAAVS